MNLRRVTLGSSAMIEAIVLLAILIGFNALACNVQPLRADLTEYREYTLSPATRNVLRNLDAVVNVRAYMSADLPSQYQPIRTEIIDLLQAFENTANDKFKLFIIEDPDPVEENLELKGIQAIQFRVSSEGEATSKNGYMGIALQRLTKTDALPVVLSSQNLEYDLISSIVRLGKKENETGKISITQGNGEPGIDDNAPLGSFVKTLRDQKFTVFSTNLDDKTEIPSTVQTLLVISPTTLSEFDKFQIDQLLMRGGNVVFFVDRFDLPSNEQGQPDFNAVPPERVFGGADLLEFYGVKAEPKMIGDPSSEVVQYQTGMLPNAHPYPFWVKVPQTNLSESNPAVNQLESVNFPWANPLRIVEENISAHPEVAVDILAQSTPAAWALAPDDDEFKGLAPWNYQQRDAVQADNIQYPLAVELSGTFTSFYAGKDDPVGERTVSTDRTRLDASEKPGRVIVISTSKFLTAGWWEQFHPNRLFMVNLADYLNLGTDLLGLRSRQLKNRPLEKQWVEARNVQERRLEPTDEQRITILNILAMPVLLVLFAAVRFGMKANRKKAYEAQMRKELAIDTRLTAAERAEMAMEGASRSGFAFPIASIIGLLAIFGIVLAGVMYQLRQEQSERSERLGAQAALLFPDFNKNEIERFEIWEILGKYVFRKAGDNWLVGHVNYTPDKSEEDRGAAMPQEDQFSLANPQAIEAVLQGIEDMQTGEFITDNDVDAVQTYVGRIGSEYRMFTGSGKLVAKFVVGKAAEDFTGTYVQVRPPEQSENFPVYKVRGYLEPVYKKKSLLDWWDPGLFNLPASAIGKLTVEQAGAPTVVVTNSAGQWSVAEPPGWTPDATKLSDWVDFVADLEVAGWLEQYETFELEQNPPDWANANLRVYLEGIGATERGPALQVITADESIARFGGNLARIGEGMVFKLKDSDVNRLRLTAADLAPAGTEAPAVEGTPETVEEPVADPPATEPEGVE